LDWNLVLAKDIKMSSIPTTCEFYSQMSAGWNARTARKIGGGGWTRTSDLRIMSRPPVPDSKPPQQLSSAKRGKAKQNPQTIRKQKQGKQDVQ
jgi:hypothetical protein